MSAYPLLTRKQLQVQVIKMAIALKGKNFHYHWYNIQRRHFLETARAVNYSPERAEALLDEMLQQVDSVIEKVTAKLQKKFPKNISHSIFEGMQSMKRKLEK